MQGRKVALTGIGLITPFGTGNEIYWDGLMEGRSAVRPAEGFDIVDMPTTHMAQLPPVDYAAWLNPTKSALWGEVARVAVVASSLALQDAGLPELDERRTGVFLGTGYGGYYELESGYITWIKRGWRRLKPTTVPRSMPNAAASHVAIQHGLRGLNFTCSTACSSGAVATGMARDAIASGQLDAVVTGGVDVIANASIMASWCALRVLSRRNDPTASRPFSADRDGLVIGEGAAVYLLEELETARKRGAHIYAEVVGVGATNDATNIVGPDERGEIECIGMALDDAGIRPEDVDYISAHGTGTKVNDANETNVLKKVFGAHAAALPISSVKGHIGHTMGAAGAIEVATTALCIDRGRIPATLHFTPGDPVCDLDYVPEGVRAKDLRYALTNSFGFGGQNSAMILKHPDA